MHTDRRTLLKGFTAAGLAVSGIGWAHAATAETPTAVLSPSGTATSGSPAIWAITSAQQDSALETAFVAGVQRATGSAQHASLQGLDSGAFTQLQQLLTDGQNTLLVGLLDDASATLVLDLVRSAGGRVLASKQHRTDVMATEWAQQLGLTLATGVPLHHSADHTGHAARVSFRCLI